MAFELFGLSGTALWVFLAGVFVLAQYLGIHRMLPMAKKSAGIVGIGGILLGLVMGGVISVPQPQQVEQSSGGAQPMQYLDVTYEGNATHVSDHDVADSVTVQFKENTSSGNLLYAGDGSDLGSVQFDIALHRIDTSNDNDIVFGIRAKNLQVENNDASNSPFDVIDTTSNGKVSVKITPSGETGTYEYNNTVVPAAGTKTITVNAQPILDEWGQNLATYDDVSRSGWITITGPNGSVQHRIEITFLKVGEVS